MKRAKIMLIAIAVVATVGGALAFKAQRFAHKDVFCATLNAQQQIVCTTTNFKWTLITEPHVTTPCSTWHDALGLGATRTSSCYTTTTCPIAIRAIVTTTNIN